MTTHIEIQSIRSTDRQRISYGGLLEGIGPTYRDVTIPALCLAPLKRALRCPRLRKPARRAAH